MPANFLDTSPIIATARTGDASKLRRELKTRARKSLYWTCKVLFNYNKLTQSFHMPLCEHIQATIPDLRRIFLCPRGFFKSTIVGKTYPLWRLMGGGLSQELQDELLEIEFKETPAHARTLSDTDRLLEFYSANQELDPRNHRILILSESQDIADKDVKDPKWHIVNNQQFRWLFPELIPENTNQTVWNNSEILLPRSRSFDESTITALGLESSGTGFHYTIIIWDDPAGEKAAGSLPLMEKAKDRMRASTGLRHDPAKTEELGAMTRWKHSTADVCGMLQEELPYQVVNDIPQGYKFFIRSAETEDPDTGERIPTFPERFPIPVLDELKRQLKDYLYNCNYMNRPSSPEGSDFNPLLYREFKIDFNPLFLQRAIPERVFNWIVPLDGTSPVALSDLYRVAFYDPSSGGKSANCESAISCLGMSPDGRIFTWKMWGKNCGYLEAIHQMMKFNDTFWLHNRYYENVGSQKEIETHVLLVNELNRGGKCQIRENMNDPNSLVCGQQHRKFNIQEFKPGSGDKFDRIRTFLQADYEAGKLYFLQNIGEGRRQILEFPHNPMVDRIDSLASGRKQLRPPRSSDEQESEKIRAEFLLTNKSSRTWTEHNYGGYV